jgi:hypothetical protein
LAAIWFKFPRAAPSAGMVAVRRHHVFVLEAHLGGDTWQVYDANSRRHQTRIHARSIAGYVIVNPWGGSVKLIGWVCLFHGGAAVLVLALAMAVGLL